MLNIAAQCYVRREALAFAGKAVVVQRALQRFIKGVELIKLPLHLQEGGFLPALVKAIVFAKMQRERPYAAPGLVHGGNRALKIAALAYEMQRYMKIVRRHEPAAAA